MQILLAAATTFEISPFVAQNPGIDVLITGVGSPATIYNLLKRVHQLDYDVVVQAGIAGTFNLSVALGEVVLVQADCFADVGMSEKGGFYSIFDKGFAKEDEFPFVGGALSNSHDLLDAFTIRKVNAITVNTVSDDVAMNDRFYKKYEADIESMEGAALHYICLQEDIPFIQLRAVSNRVGERDKSKWKMDESIANLNTTLHTMVQDLMTGNIITPKQPR